MFRLASRCFAICMASFASVFETTRQRRVAQITPPKSRVGLGSNQANFAKSAKRESLCFQLLLRVYSNTDVSLHTLIVRQALFSIPTVFKLSSVLPAYFQISPPLQKELSSLESSSLESALPVQASPVTLTPCACNERKIVS